MATIDLPSALHECFHQRSGNVIEYRADEPVQQAANPLSRHADLPGLDQNCAGAEERAGCTHTAGLGQRAVIPRLLAAALEKARSLPDEEGAVRLGERRELFEEGIRLLV